MSDTDDRWNKIEVEMTKGWGEWPVYFFDFSFGVFNFKIEHTRSDEPIDGRLNFWNVGIYRNSLPAFQTYVDDRPVDVVRDYRRHPCTVDVYRKWFYLKNLILKSKKD